MRKEFSLTAGQEATHDMGKSVFVHFLVMRKEI